MSSAVILIFIHIKYIVNKWKKQCELITHHQPLLGILSAFLFFLGTIDEAEDPNMEGEERLWVSRNPHRKNDKSLRALVLLAMKSTFPVSL